MGEAGPARSPHYAGIRVGVCDVVRIFVGRMLRPFRAGIVCAPFPRAGALGFPVGPFQGPNGNPHLSAIRDRPRFRAGSAQVWIFLSAGCRISLDKQIKPDVRVIPSLVGSNVRDLKNCFAGWPRCSE